MKKKILLVDDNDVDHFLNQRLISNGIIDIEIEIAMNGQEAIDYLRNTSELPHLILLDINMPIMNGHEFLKEFDTFKKSIPIIIMLTSSSQTEDKEKAMNYQNVRDFFLKPLTKEKITNINNLLEKCLAS